MVKQSTSTCIVRTVENSPPIGDIYEVTCHQSNRVVNNESKQPRRGGNDAQRGAGWVPVAYFSCSMLVGAPTRLGCLNRIAYMRVPKAVATATTRDRVNSVLASHTMMYDALGALASTLASVRTRESGRLVVAWRQGGAGSRSPWSKSVEKISTSVSVPCKSSQTRRTMTVMRDEMNWPMAETINRVSDQNLGKIDVSGSEETYQ